MLTPVPTGIVQCSKDGLADTCANAGVDTVKFFGEDIDAGTLAVIGKSTVVIEEHQNWRVLESEPTP